MANSYTGFLLTLAAAVDDAGKALVNANNLIKTVKRDLKPEPAALYSTINVSYAASSFSATNLTSGTLSLSDATATPVAVALDKHPALGFGLPDYDTIRMMDVASARDLFVDEAIKKILETINGYIAALITAGNFSAVTSGGTGDTITYAEFLTTWNTLVTAKVPVKDYGNMFLMMHNTVYKNTFAQADFITASYVGDQAAGSARATAKLPMMLGIIPDYDQDMPVDTGVYTSLMYHRNAMCLVARPPEVENGLGVQQTVAFYDGIPIRISISYNPLSFTKQLTFDVFCGVKVIRAALACRHTTT